MAKVSDALNNMTETPIQMIKLVQFVPGGEATERFLNSMTSRELVDIQKKDMSAYYSIGEYWYIVSQA